LSHLSVHVERSHKQENKLKATPSEIEINKYNKRIEKPKKRKKGKQ
jgi:hypothetical protein